MDDDPKWRRIAETVADDIRSGRQPVGSKLPAADDPAETARHGADPNTIRDARDYLRAVGVLRISNRGSFVAAVPPDVLPERPPRESAVERRLNARIGELEKRVAKLERGER